MLNKNENNALLPCTQHIIRDVGEQITSYHQILLHTTKRIKQKAHTYTALFSPAPRCYLDSPDLCLSSGSGPDTTHYHSFFRSLPSLTSSLSSHLLPSWSSLPSPDLFLLSHGGGCRRRARATQVSGEKLGAQRIQDLLLLFIF